MQKLLAKIKKHAIAIAGILLIAVTVTVSVVLQHKKEVPLEPNIVTFYSNDLKPARISIDSTGKSVLGSPDKLRVYFDRDISFQSEEENENLKNIQISPDLQGQWQWEDSSRLSFTPQKEWTPNQKYTVKFPKDLIRTSQKENPLKLSKNEFDFSTPSFDRNISYLKLYQDPKDPKIYKAISEITFTHPVNPEEFEKTITLVLDKKPLSYEVIYDEYKRYATITSVQVKITDAPQLINLNLAKMSTASASARTLDIPSSSKFFRLDSVTSQIVRNDKDEPEQVLFVNFTDGVTEKNLQGKVKAYLLPKNNKDKKKRNEIEKANPNPEICSQERICECDEDGTNNCPCRVENVCRKVSHMGSYRSYDEWAPSDITPEVLKTLQEVDLQAVPTSNEYDKMHSFKYRADNNKNNRIYVVISAPLKSSSGFDIKNVNALVINVPSFPREVKIVGSGSILALGGSKKLSFTSRGVEGIKVELSRVLPGKINHLVSQTGGRFDDPYFRNSYYFNEEDISEVFSEVIPLQKDDVKATYSSLDLDSYLEKGKTGLFIIKSYGYNPKTQSSLTNTDKRFILVTDLGILTKKDINDNTRVFVMSINKGTPVYGAKVEVIGKNGLPLFTKTTSAQGYVDFPSLRDFRREKEPVAFVVTQGQDVSYMPVDTSDRNVNYSRFQTDGVYYSSYKSKGLSAFLFTDRGIYRPGETINIGAVVKTPEWSSVAGIPVKLTLVNPKSKNVYERMISLNKEGLAEFTIPTEYTFPTGTYHAYLYDVTNIKRPVNLGNTSLRLEEFQEDKLRITAQLLGSDRKGWQPLEGLSAKIKLENLFGTAASGNLIKADLTLNPLTFSFSKYKGFTFDDPYRNRNAISQSANERLINNEPTDENGVITKDIDLSKYSGGSYRLTLNSEGFEKESGSSVSAADSLWVSPNRYLVGYKSVSNLRYLKRNSEASVDFVAIDPDLNKITLNKMKTKLVQIQHVSTLVKQYNGTYKYQSIVKEQEKEVKDFAISDKGASFTIPTTDPGDYALDVYDEFNQKVSRVKFFVAGSANLTYSLEKDAELVINLEKEEVEPGADIVLNLITPYTGAGLITIEREKVFAQKWFTTTSTSSQQRITVPADFEGNGYINISFIRGIDSKEIFTAPHSYAVVPFYVKRDKRDVKINIDAPSLVKPGDDLNITYSADKPVKIILYGVNEGILQVAKYSLPKPLNHFFKKMALEVKTRQIVDLILPDYKMVKEIASTGGDDDEDARKALAAGLNPFARKRDKPVVFWSGLLEADTKERTYTYKVPSYFNGEIKLMAVAANAEATGSASTPVTVRAPIVLMPSTAYVAVPGDILDANLRISNNKKDSVDGKIEVSIATSEHLEVVGDKTVSLEVPYGQEKMVNFKVKALEKLGSAYINYTAEHKNPKDMITAQNTLSVRPATVYATVLTTKNEAKVPFDIKNFQRDMYPFEAQRSLFISNSPLVLAKGLATYFKKYPHGCSEQITSQVFPFLSLSSLGGSNNIVDRKEVEESFNTAQNKLKRRQVNNGGFSLWDGGSSDSRDVTLYVMHFFTDAKELGFNVDSNMFDKGLERLDDYASKYPTSISESYDIAFANYLLARNGKVVTNYLLRTQEYLDKNQKNWQETLTGAYIASTYALLKDEAKARTIINAFKPEGQKYIFYSDYDSSSIRNAKYMYLIGKHFPELLNKHSEIIKALVGAVVENNYNTMSSSTTIMALAAYSQAAAGKDSLIKVEGHTGKNTEKTNFALKQEGFPKALIDDKATEITVSSSDIGPLGVYYILSTQGFDKKPDTASSGQGLDIVKEFRDENGKVVKEATVGQDLTVSIKIKTSGTKETVTNVAITDLLPGSFEIVSGSLSGSTDFYDMREDRALIYLTATRSIREITYKVKVIASGEYMVPMLHASSLYDKDIYGYVKAGTITVKPVN